MGHKSAQVLFKFILFCCLVGSLSWLISGQKVHANGTTSAIIKLANGSDISSVAADHNAVVAESIPTLDIFLLESDYTNLQSQLVNDSRVVSVSEDSVIVGQPRYAGAVGQELEAQPWNSGDDPSTAYSKQWATSSIRLGKAHSISQGEGITVAVLDTGIDLDHALFQGKLVAGYDFVDDDTVPAEVRDGFDQDGDVDIDEGAGHGTHVAGIIALTAPKAKIMPIRIFDDEGKGLYFDLVAGFIYAVDNGADVINLSGSGSDDANFLADAIAYAETHGVVVVSAGGVNSLGYPAGYSSVISVGASDQLDYPTDFSNFSALANTVYAPGLSIISGYDDGSYAMWTGNSMATPFVAGTAALLMATDVCDADCAKTTILDTAHPVVDDPESTDYYGRLDAFDAVSFASNQYHADMSVMVMDGDLGEKNGDEQIKPHFNIVNKGNSLPLSELTLRYWFARDGESSQLVECDYAAVQCNAITGETITTAETAVTDTYLQLNFAPAAGILLGNHETGNIQLRIHKTDWQPYDELNDYSYNGAASFTESQQVTLYHNGQLIWGEEPVGSGGSSEAATPAPTLAPTNTPLPANTPESTSTPTPTNIPWPTSTPVPTNTPLPTSTNAPSPEPTAVQPPTDELRVQYRAFDSDPYNNNLQPQLQLVNESSNAIPLSELRLRYWFTDEATAVSIAHCDYAVLGNDKITAVSNSTGTQHYIDIAFSEAAGELEAGNNSGAIYLRIHHDNWTPHDESDDYSFSSAQTSFIDWQNVTLYHNNQLIWGIEP